MGYVATYNSSALISSTIDFLVSVLIGAAKQGLLIGAAVAITIIVILYSGALGKIGGLIEDFLNWVGQLYLNY